MLDVISDSSNQHGLNIWKADNAKSIPTESVTFNLFNTHSSHLNYCILEHIIFICNMIVHWNVYIYIYIYIHKHQTYLFMKNAHWYANIRCLFMRDNALVVCDVRFMLWFFVSFFSCLVQHYFLWKKSLFALQH